MRTSICMAVLLLCAGSAAAADELAIAAGGKSQPFARYWEDYERCKARQEFTPQRGEYETQAEYRLRVEQLRVGCDTYRRVEQAHIDVPLELRYDADAQRFLFELPMTKELRLRYDELVANDFPPVLLKLPRERWHIDDPTPKASAYKECTLRNVVADDQFIRSIESYRTDSWRGCMTYYLQDEEETWRRDSATFFISDVTFYGYAEIDRARRMKEMENDLVYRIKGALLVPEQAFEAGAVEIRNHRTGVQLISLKP